MEIRLAAGMDRGQSGAPRNTNRAMPGRECAR